MKELKKCPFCGSENVEIYSRGNTFGIDIYVECECGANVQICEGYGEEELIKRWNRRCCDCALEELEAYHTIGTLEECDEARKKQKAMKIEEKHLRNINGDVTDTYYYCPNCGELIELEDCEYCTNCGQAIDRSDSK